MSDGYILTHKNGTVQILRDRAPDGYEIRECKIEAIIFWSPPPDEPGQPVCEHNFTDKYPGVLFALGNGYAVDDPRSPARWCCLCGSLQWGPGKEWIAPKAHPPTTEYTLRASVEAFVKHQREADDKAWRENQELNARLKRGETITVMITAVTEGMRPPNKLLDELERLLNVS